MFSFQDTNVDDDFDSEEEISPPDTVFYYINDDRTFQELLHLVSEIIKSSPSSGLETSHRNSIAIAIASDYEDDNNRSAESNNTAASNCPPAASITAVASKHTSRSSGYERQLKMLIKDVEYIRANSDKLEISPSSDMAESLLSFLKDAAKNMSPEDFQPQSINLNKLLHVVANLKLLIPIEPLSIEKKKGATQREGNFPSGSITEKDTSGAEMVRELASHPCEEWGMDGLLTAYNSLGNTEKLCLLCFSIFTCDVGKYGKRGVLVKKSLVINKRILIYLWVGERYIDPEHDKLQQNKTVEEIGDRILEVLTKRGFIEPVMKMSGGVLSSRYQMHTFMHSLVSALARRAGFLDFSREDGELNSSFDLSQRACLLKYQGSKLSSCQLWANETKDLYSLHKFTSVQTLFNVNESRIQIEPLWFSRMKYLSVLRLGSWRCDAIYETIEVVDSEFLEHLKSMKQLRLFSLQGVSSIRKLPVSACSLTNLIILDLKECSDLEELPTGIGSLQNLTHLDVTDCHLLFKLPKGLCLLRKLQLLRGFKIYEPLGPLAGDQQDHVKSKSNKQACSLQDLRKLENLRVLSIVTARESFPTSEEVQVFKDMRKLNQLKISWQGSPLELQTQQVQASSVAIAEDSNFNWNCFKRRHSSQEDTDRNRSEHEFLDQIQKLELLCFPYELAPDWLNPNQFKNLQKLYICGGKRLRKLPGCVNGNSRWASVTTLRLSYLPNLEIQWRQLKELFPNMKYLHKYECRKLGLFPCDHNGVARL